VRFVPDFREDGSVAGFYILASDVTELKRTEEMLRDSRRQLSLALEGSQLALFDWNVVTGEVFLGERWAAMLGRPAQETRTTFAALEELVHPEDRELVDAWLRDVLKGTSSHYRTEHRVRTDDGRWLWIQSHGQVTERDEAGGARRMLGTQADITERKRAERELAESRAELERAALYDSLTGLPNRRLLEDRMQLALARARRGQQIIAVMCLDVDHFKTINDTMGHPAGDAVLKEFAARLNGCTRASDTAARLGGDEFVVLLEDLHRPDDVRVLAEKIIGAMAEKFRIGAGDLSVTTSIGIACSGRTETGDEMLLRADAALYEAKRAGRNRFQIAASALYVISDNAPVARPERAGKP
jgi:diguanylate cyclase (GGDEF)-like protein/PAS domain S-box-containing protein